VLFSPGHGAFAPRVDYPTSFTASPSVLAADLNRDGRPDLAVANHDGRTVSVLLNSCLP
jgi:hypothetical protein